MLIPRRCGVLSSAPHSWGISLPSLRAGSDPTPSGRVPGLSSLCSDSPSFGWVPGLSSLCSDSPSFGWVPGFASLASWAFSTSLTKCLYSDRLLATRIDHGDEVGLDPPSLVFHRGMDTVPVHRFRGLAQGVGVEQVKTGSDLVL